MDLSPGYRELAPPPPLQSTVACLWIRVPSANDDEPVRILPDACSDVIWAQGRGTFVAGPDTSAYLSRPDGLLVGLRFRPGAGGAGLNLPLDELTDQRADITDVDATYAVSPDAEPDQALRKLIDAAHGREPDPLVAAAVQGHDVGLSERQLRRRFKAATGYGPKTLARIQRFLDFVARSDAEPDETLAALALDAGYADQAHLTRECTRLAGLPPAQLIRARAALPPSAGTASPRTL
jgi:AraC-like DNA-binding protein